MNILFLGIDLAKNVGNQLCRLNEAGKPVLYETHWPKIAPDAGKIIAYTVGSEASTGAFYCGSVSLKLGHKVKVISPR